MAAIFDAMGNVIGDDGMDPAPTAQIKPDVGYLQGKINEFQNVLFSLDETASNLETMLMMDITEEQVNQIQDLLTQYYDRKSAFKFAAEAFNGVSSLVNSMGGSMRELTIPSGLGFAPLAIPVATAAALAGAAVLVSFALGWLATSKNLAKDIALSISDPVKRDEALATASAIAAADSGATGGSLGTAASIVKWAAIAGAVYLGWKMYQKESA